MCMARMRVAMVMPMVVFVVATTMCMGPMCVASRAVIVAALLARGVLMPDREQQENVEAQAKGCKDKHQPAQLDCCHVTQRS